MDVALMLGMHTSGCRPLSPIARRIHTLCCPIGASAHMLLSRGLQRYGRPIVFGSTEACIPAHSHDPIFSSTEWPISLSVCDALKCTAGM